MNQHDNGQHALWTTSVSDTSGMSLPNTRISTHRQSTARAAATAAPKRKASFVTETLTPQLMLKTNIISSGNTCSCSLCATLRLFLTFCALAPGKAAGGAPCIKGFREYHPPRRRRRAARRRRWLTPAASRRRPPYWRPLPPRPPAGSPSSDDGS